LQISFEKFSRGLELRALAAEYGIKNKPLPNQFKKKIDSIARDYHCEMFGHHSPGDRKNYLDVVVAKVSFQQKTLAGQQNTFSVFEHLTNTPYLKPLILGNVYLPDNHFSLDDVQSTMDYSLYAQYLLSTSESEFTEQLRSALKVFFRRVNILVFGEEAVSLPTFLEKMRGSKRTAVSINDIRYKLLDLKEHYWQIYGVDIFDISLSTIYPNDLYTEVTEFHDMWMEICGWNGFLSTFRSLWNSSEIFTGYKVKNSPSNFTSLEEERVKAEVTNLLNYRQKDPILLAYRSAGEPSFELAAFIAKSVQEALEKRNIQKALKLICTLALLDESYFSVMNWDYLDKCIPTSCGVYTFSRAFVELLFLKVEENGVPSNVDRGLGTLTGVLAELIEALRLEGKDIRQILFTIRGELPRPAATKITEFLISLRSLERFSSKLPLPYSLAKNIKSDDERIMTLRLTLVNEAEDTYLVSKPFKSKILSDEKRAFAIRKLRDEISKGMIRVSWDIVLSQIHAFSENIGMYEEVFEGEEEHQIFSIWIEDLVETILFSGANSIDYLLGANLRHGRILTAYMSAFTKVVGQLQGIGNVACDWHDSQLREVLGEDYPILNITRARVESKIKEFISFWLTINDDGMLSRALAKNIEEYVIENTKLSLKDNLTFQQNLLEIIQITIVEFIDKANKEFIENVIPQISECIAKARNDLLDKGKSSVIGDLLVTHIKILNSEIPHWINVVLEEDDFDDFTAYDIVNLESQFTTLLNIDENKVSISYHSNSDVNAPDEIIFSGHVFTLLNEVIHNLFSNAIKYSGYGSDTPIHFIFQRYDDDLTITAVNTLNKEATKKVLKKLPSAILKAESTLASTRRQDRGSGFAKIRTIAQQYSIDTKIHVSLDENTNEFTSKVELGSFREGFFK